MIGAPPTWAAPMSIAAGSVSWPSETPTPWRLARASGCTRVKPWTPSDGGFTAPITTSSPTWSPDEVGANATSILQSASAGIAGLQSSASTSYSPPVVATVTGSEPYGVRLVTLKRIDSLVEPTGTLPKSWLVGWMTSGGGGVPVPERSMKCSPAAVLSWMQIDSVWKP